MGGASNLRHGVAARERGLNHQAMRETGRALWDFRPIRRAFRYAPSRAAQALSRLAFFDLASSPSRDTIGVLPVFRTIHSTQAGDRVACVKPTYARSRAGYRTKVRYTRSACAYRLKGVKVRRRVRRRARRRASRSLPLPSCAFAACMSSVVLRQAPLCTPSMPMKSFEYTSRASIDARRHPSMRAASTAIHSMRYVLWHSPFCLRSFSPRRAYSSAAR